MLHLPAPRASALLVLCLAPVVHAQESSDDILGNEPDRLSALEDVSFGSQDGTWDWGRSDSMAPIGVAYSRRLQPGAWLLGYTFQRTQFDGLQRGRDAVVASDLGAGSIAALEQTKITHTLEGWYALDAEWSAFVRVPFHDNERDSQVVGGARRTRSADGIGDVELGAAWDVYAEDGAFLRLHLGLGFPTGSSNESDGTGVVPLGLQPGTGAFNLHPGVTWTVQKRDWSWGSQLVGRFALERNDEGYGVGDIFEPSVWIAHDWDHAVSTSLRLRGHYASDFTGQHRDLDIVTDPTNDANNQGSDRHDILAGAQWRLGDPREPHHLFGIEAGVPFDEWNSGTNLETEWFLTLGYRLAL